ncbi:UNVERIFIED_CONTAM: hypothetical protein K2H54_015381 [Gekko kuhli]
MLPEARRGERRRLGEREKVSTLLAGLGSCVSSTSRSARFHFGSLLPRESLAAGVGGASSASGAAGAVHALCSGWRRDD